MFEPSSAASFVAENNIDGEEAAHKKVVLCKKRHKIALVRSFYHTIGVAKCKLRTKSSSKPNNFILPNNRLTPP